MLTDAGGDEMTSGGRGGHTATIVTVAASIAPTLSSTVRLAKYEPAADGTNQVAGALTVVEDPPVAGSYKLTGPDGP
jgi:hypothetical protein